jgi:hypothetical protein
MMARQPEVPNLMVTLTEELLLVAADGAMVSYKAISIQPSAFSPWIILDPPWLYHPAPKTSALNVSHLGNA